MYFITTLSPAYLTAYVLFWKIIVRLNNKVKIVYPAKCNPSVANFISSTMVDIY